MSSKLFRVFLLLTMSIFVLFPGFVKGDIPLEERAALIALYNATDGDNWYDNSGWKGNNNEADGFSQYGSEGSWEGISVSQGNDHVRSIRFAFRDDNLVGYIPPELGNLSNLTYLELSDNQLSGSIPAELGNLSNLTSLTLYSNQLSGSIPAELGNLSSVTYLGLSGNQLSGSIPAELGNLSNLTSLGLRDNQLSGNVPAELGNLSNLTIISLQNNRLSGIIPAEWADLPNLTEISLENNRLSGTIPEGFGVLANLSYLRLHGNQFIGNVPVDFITLGSSGSPAAGYFTINYNALSTADSSIKAFLDFYYPGWSKTQTVAPTGLSAVPTSTSEITVSWTPLQYTGDTGGYTVFYSTQSDGPWTNSGTTANKTASNFAVSGLNSGTIYYFRVRTETYPHAENEGTVISGYTALVDATTNSPTMVYALTARSTPESGVEITVSPTDNNGGGDGATDFTRTYDSGTLVTLTAPAAFNGMNFSKWTIDGADNASQSIQVTMDTDHSLLAFYAGTPSIRLSRSQLDFAAEAGSVSGSQALVIENSGYGTLNWTLTPIGNWLSCSPTSGTNTETISVSVDPTGLEAGMYTSVIIVSDVDAANSPQNLVVTLKVYNPGAGGPPFGAFDTPVDGSTVSGSVPITGWALDDVETTSVKIFRSPIQGSGQGRIHVGDAVFVEGARPDIETAFPGYPFNYRAGWGYMLLTNSLPTNGNGTFTLYADAEDNNGNVTQLGSKTITCDNANSVKPFGAMDTPAQSGDASGADYLNVGWVLTPLPNTVPIDGSTIKLWVDGVLLPNSAVYNYYREDIEALFPDYNNSDGAGCYFYFDTSQFTNGVHTIAWTATDDAGNTDGIGSRYFNVLNTAPIKKKRSRAFLLPYGVARQEPESSSIPFILKKGYDTSAPGETVIPGRSGEIIIRIHELESFHLTPRHREAMEKDAAADGFRYYGYLDHDGKREPLPVGVTFDQRGGNLFWQPGVGFHGEYIFVILEQGSDGKVRAARIRVIISPKS
ncbi:MAG: hypothetical protein GY765_07410 [bacterium]|nr:hypothetical protein [bacterium]